MTDKAKEGRRNSLVGAALAIGGGLGMIIGLLVGGGSGIAIGMIFGAGIGLVFGAAWDGLHRSD